VADQGLGYERLSRVEENKALAVERRAAAERDHEAGLLDLVKAIKELDHMDIDQLTKLVAIAQSFREQDQAQEQKSTNAIPSAGGENASA